MGALLAGGIFLILMLGLAVLIIASLWVIFSKAGQPGVAAIVPIWNAWVLVTGVAKKEPLWFVLMLIPFVNIIAAIMVWAEVAKKFGYSGGFVVGVILLPFIFIPVMAFGGTYQDGRRKKSRRDEYEEEYEEEYDRPRRRSRRDDD